MAPFTSPRKGGGLKRLREAHNGGKLSRRLKAMLSRTLIEPGVAAGNWWHRLGDGRLQCDLCPRECKLHPGQRGFCFVREARESGIALASYGRASGFCID